jgi:hypothetical protein
MNARSRSAAALVAAVAALGTAAPAYASGGADDHGRHGGGSKAATASVKCAGGVLKLKAKQDDGRIEVEAEVDTNRNGQRWSMRIVDNGKTAWKGSRVTHAPSGSFSVEKRIANRKGKDVVTVRVARRGTVCATRVTA